LIGESEARREIELVCAHQRARRKTGIASSLSRQHELARDVVEVSLPVVHFRLRRKKVIADAVVQSKPLANLPGVLKVRGEFRASDTCETRVGDDARRGGYA